MNNTIIHQEFNKLYNNGYLVFKQNPTCRNIFISNKKSKKQDQQYFLSFPTILFKVHYRFVPKTKLYYANSLRIVFANKKLNKIYYPKLLNVCKNFQVCTKYAVGENLEEIIKNTLENFWSYKFNWDICQMFDLYYPKNKNVYTTANNSFSKWQENTKNNLKYLPKFKLIPDVLISGLRRNAAENFICFS